jgi:hypothetical protein
MTSFPRSPRTLKGGLVVMDQDGNAVLRTITFQFNPDTAARTLSARGGQVDAGDRLEGLRLRGPPIETIKLDVELDATDRLERPEQNQEVVENGLLPDLAELEMLISPATADLRAADQLALSGTIEIMPLPSPLLLLVLGANRTLPVRLTDFSILEEAFDTRLNPIRARVSLSLRVLSIDDLAFGSKGGALYMAFQQQRERFSRRKPANLQALGLKASP